MLNPVVWIMLLLFSWPSVCEVCTNYEVMMFQPLTRTPPDLGYFSDIYIYILLIPAPPFSAPHPMSNRGGYTIMPLTSLPFQLLCLHKGSFAHPGVTCLHLSIPRSIATCIRIRYLPDSSTLSTPSRFQTPLPFHHQNFF